MKKVVLRLTSLLLCFIFIFGCVGCGNTKEKLKGTQAAKLLLANERLDSNLLNDSINSIFGSNASAQGNFGSSGTHILGSLGKLNLPFLNEVGSFQLSGDTYTWSNFGDYSNISSFFESYRQGVIGSVEQSTAMIDQAKKDITITDQWVGDDISALMLSVTDTSDILYERNEYAYKICKRYTNSEAQNVYEIFQQDTYEDGTEVYLRMLCIPDQRYEFSLYSTAGMELYLIMENSRGYWNMLCLSDVDHGVNITNIMTSASISYVFDYYMSYSATSPETTSLKILNADKTCDLLSITGDSITIYPSGFHGISSLQATVDASNVSHGEPISDAAIMEIEGHYSTNTISPSIVLSNGNVIQPEENPMDQLVFYRYGNVSHTADGYFAALDFTVAGNSITEKLNNLRTYLNTNGISCKVSMDTIIANAPTGDILLNQFLHSYSWNGYTINTGSNIASAISTEKNNYNTYKDMYTAIKDNPTISYSELADRNALNDINFAKIDNITMGDVTFDDYNITVKDMSLSISDTTLLEAGTNYTIQLAYAALTTDADGNTVYDPCSIYPFSSENKTITSYNEGNNFTANQSATFNCKGMLEPDTFHVVAYIATEDGIRISQLTPVIFSNDTVSLNDTFPLVNLTINLNDAKNLVAIYEYNNDILLENTNPKDIYTYEEIYNLLLNGVLNHGTPDSTEIEQLVNDSEMIWEKVNTDASFETGVIRMKYIKEINNEQLEAYVYIEL